jgi:predicted ATPase/DNA-binding SARP family transcriptional activator
MQSLSVAVLGPFLASLGDRALNHFRTRSVQALLVYLLVEGQAQAREWLTELIWPGLPPASGRKNLRQTLYELRQLVPEVAARAGGEAVPLLLADRQTVRLNPAAATRVDTDAFEEYLEQGTAEALAAGVALYRGDFLAGFYLPDSAEFEAWMSSRQALYRRRALEALERLAGRYLEQGAYDRAETYARQQLALDDLREPAVRQLMLALAAQGQRSEALRLYEEAQERLDEALQVAPSSETTGLRDQIRAEQLPGSQGLPADAGPAQAPDGVDRGAVVAHNLSQPATALVGRHSELAALETLLGGAGPERLITILGPGGSGKTRLALETALKQVEATPVRFPDGIWFVPLAALSDPQAVVAETAKVLGFSFAGEGPEPRQQLLDYLRPRRLMLVLDNYDHLLAGDTRPLPADILAAAPQVKVLVTSRTRLSVQGEQLFPLRGLAVPGPEVSPAEAANYEAVALFEQLGRRGHPGFVLDEEALPAVTRICRLVAGLPLAIEMAASWLAALPAEAIAAEIERGLDILEAEWQDVPARQRSLRAVFVSSWQMLGDEERHALKRLALFRGGFEREAAAAVAGASLRVLLSLVNKSWLAREGGDRYQMHEVLRQYAYEALQAEPAAWREARTVHAHYFAARLASWNEALRGTGQVAALDALATDFENVRSAWGWLVESGQTTTAAKEMLAGLVLFCSARSRESDLQAMVQQAQGAGPVEPEAEALLLTAEAAFARGYYAIRYFVAHFVSIPQPQEIIERAWRYLRRLEAGELDGLWLVLIATLVGWATKRSLQLEGEREAHRRLRAWMVAFREQGDHWADAFAMENLGRLLSQLRSVRPAGEVDEEQDSRETVEAQRLLTRAATGFEQLGDRLEYAHTLRLLGQHLLYRDAGQSEQVLEKARALFMELGDRQAAAQVLWSLAQQSLWLGQYARGFTLFDEVVGIYENLGSRRLTSFALSLESQEALRFSDVEHARRTRQRSLALSQEIGDRLGTAWSLWELGEIERVAREPETARRHYEAAREMFDQMGDRFGLAFYHRGLGDLALAEGDPQTAMIAFDRALQVNRDVGHEWTTAYLLAGLGRAARALGDAAAARRYLQDAVRAAQRIGHEDLMLLAMVDWSALEAADGRAERALALVAFIECHTNTWREARSRVAPVGAGAAAALGEQAAVAARARGQALTMAEAVSWILGAGGAARSVK